MINAPILNPEMNPYSGWDMRTLLEVQAERFGEKTCLAWEPFEGSGVQWTYREFVEKVASTGAGLAARGIGRGDRVIIHLENCPEQLFSWLGCAWIGAVAVTTNAKSSAAELSYFADVSKARAAITQPKFAELLSAAFPQAEWIAITTTDAGDAPFRAPAFADSFETLLRSADDTPTAVRDCAAPFGVQFTSGTTSRPKGVLWTHANALWGGHVSAAHEALQSSDVHLVTMPLFHTNAQSYSVLAALWAGATIVLQPRFSASRFWPVSLKHKCTWTSMVPFVLRALINHEVPEHSYRMWGNGACDMPFDEHFGVRTLGWWGMTETITHGIVGSPFHADRPMSMGRPAPEYGISVRREDGSTVERGETGDLFVHGVRGLSLFSEYLENPEATASAFAEDGWMITGDRVTLADDGWLVFADRSKDMLKVGGENVAASEIESVLSALPGVREVAVVAKKHKMLEEVPVAFIQLTVPVAEASPDFTEQALAHCATQLATFKVPHEVRLVDELPRATLEKIAKAELRKMLEAEGE